MATVTGFTAERMQEIEDSTVIDGDVVGNDLVLLQRDGTPINAGNVRGPQGPQGVPGEVTNAALTAAVAPSVQSGNDLTTGSDGKLFFDHQKNYFHNVAVFADAAARTAAIPSPSPGQMVYMLSSDCVFVYTTANGWRPPFGQPWGHIDTKIDTTLRAGFAAGPQEISTALRCSVTTVAGRLLRATFNAILTPATLSPAPIVDLYNQTGSGVIGRFWQSPYSGGVAIIATGTFIFSSVAGTRVYTARLSVVGGGTMDVSNTVANPSRLTIEDIGPETSVINF